LLGEILAACIFLVWLDVKILKAEQDAQGKKDGKKDVIVH
jgi:hypothetical protein